MTKKTEADVRAYLATLPGSPVDFEIAQTQGAVWSLSRDGEVHGYAVAFWPEGARKVDLKGRTPEEIEAKMYVKWLERPTRSDDNE